MSAKIVYMGTPDFAVPALQALVKTSGQAAWHVVAVVTQPDRLSGRGKKLTPPPVKVAAQAANIPVLQPEKLRRDVVAQLATYAPDVIVVAAFGQILRKRLLNLPPRGCINIHASLLPRWRGAAPIAAAIKAGDTETGVTLMQMDSGLDTGPMIAARPMPISPQHTTGSLTADLAQLGGDFLVETLPAWLAGEITPQPQTDDLATLAPRLQKSEGEIDWSLPAAQIERTVRAFSPWPGTFTFGLRGQIKIIHAEVVTPNLPNLPKPGTLFKYQKAPYVATGDGVLRLIKVQPAGKKVMPAEAMLNGLPELWNTTLGE